VAASTTERVIGVLLAAGVLAGLGVVVGAGCAPDLGAPPSQVSSLRILAISGTPAEAKPGTMVAYSALLVDGTGERPDLAAGIHWAFCNQPKPLSDLDDVTAACFTLDSESFLTDLGQGPTATGALPLQACSLFGPDAPPSMAGMPAGRPADPDPSGGYYQPVRLILQAAGQLVLAAEESRITCGLPGATSTTLASFTSEYQPNTNPTITSVVAVDAQTGSPLASVAAGQTVTLRTSWPACAPGMTSCGGAEAYALYDEQSQTVTPRCEAMTVSWFATTGTFAVDRSSPDAGAGGGLQVLDGGVDGGAPGAVVAACDGATFADGQWTAPTTPGTALVWAVLRDDRGGVAWQRYSIDVTP